MNENEIKKLARDFFRENAEANSLVRKATATRKKLFAAMKEAGIDSLETSTAGVPLVAAIEAPTRNSVDVAKLGRLVDNDTFFSCVSATAKAVETWAGKAILDECIVPGKGTENVTVKAKK